MAKRIRHLEPYGYMDQDNMNSAESMLSSDIANIKRVNNEQEKEIDSKTVSIVKDSSSNKYIFYQGNNKIGEVSTSTVVDHAEVIEVGDITYLRLYFDETGENYVDIDLTELMEHDSFNDSDTIDFTVRGQGMGRNITADVVDGSIGLEKLTSEFNELLNGLATKDYVDEVSAMTEYLNDAKADKSDMIWEKSETADVFAEVKNKDGDVVAQLKNNGDLFLIVEGELRNVNELLAQLANETYTGGDTFTP